MDIDSRTISVWEIMSSNLNHHSRALSYTVAVESTLIIYKRNERMNLTFKEVTRQNSKRTNKSFERRFSTRNPGLNGVVGFSLIGF